MAKFSVIDYLKGLSKRAKAAETPAQIARLEANLKKTVRGLDPKWRGAANRIREQLQRAKAKLQTPPPRVAAAIPPPQTVIEAEEEEQEEVILFTSKIKPSLDQVGKYIDGFVDTIYIRGEKHLLKLSQAFAENVETGTVEMDQFIQEANEIQNTSAALFKMLDQLNEVNATAVEGSAERQLADDVGLSGVLRGINDQLLKSARELNRLSSLVTAKINNLEERRKLVEAMVKTLTFMKSGFQSMVSQLKNGGVFIENINTFKVITDAITREERKLKSYEGAWKLTLVDMQKRAAKARRRA